MTLTLLLITLSASWLLIGWLACHVWHVDSSIKLARESTELAKVAIDALAKARATDAEFRTLMQAHKRDNDQMIRWRTHGPS